MTGYKQIARKEIDQAVNDGKLDGIPDRRLEDLEMQLALELLETSEAFVDFVSKSNQAGGYDRVREDLETFADVAAASMRASELESRRAA
jgi:hypothetical protein